MSQKMMIVWMLCLICLLPTAVMAKGKFDNNPDVQKAESYLQSLKTAKADFVQISSLGSRLSGQFYLNRPGKLRFDYNEVDDFVVADGLFVYFYDSQLGEQSNAPIGQTLADFLLREDLSLSGDLEVRNVFREEGYLHIAVVQTDNPAAGAVELVFSEIPFDLNRWKVTDAQGLTTEVMLKNIQKDVVFGNDVVFGYLDPKGRRPFNN